MATATRTRKSTRKPEPRHVSISKPVNGCYAIALTIGEGEKAKRYHYFLEPIAADFGIGFRFEKFVQDQAEGEPSEYAVNIDLQQGHHTCECKGFLRHGMTCGKNRSADEQRGCKHVASVLSLLQSGRIQTPASKPTRVVNPVCFLCEQPYEACRCTI